MTTWNFPMMITDHGQWHYKDEMEKQLIENLIHDSDRAVGIIGGAIIDVRLEDAIKFRTKRDKKIDDRLFQASGPLGSFATKIDLAFMLGLVSKDAHSDLMQIKEIRNAFAHNLSIKDFSSPKVRDKAKALSLINSLVVNFENKPGAFVFSFGSMAKPKMAVRDYDAVRSDPKRRYITTISLFNSSLMVAELPAMPAPFI